ncbi:MAG TPA: RluA family pseudouridine synthase, partial [Bdellovibrionales bacterium]|nr:RluA family pseudouridine synthase [Bdellovibrionales bacterium]
MRKKLSFKVPPEARGARLDAYLAQALGEKLPQVMSKAKARKLIMAGAVYLNQKRVRIASKELIVGALVDVIIDPERLFSDKASQQPPFEVRDNDVLFEDQWLIAVNKPAGIPTQPTLDQARDHLYAAVQRFLARRDKKAQPYVGLHHRLDFDTSGVVLFTKAREANKGVSALFAERLAQKTYHALSWNLSGRQLPVEWTVKNHLGRAGTTGKDRMRFKSVKAGGDYAETQLRVLGAKGQVVHVEARPKTGRTHQIRVHLS